MKFNRVRFPNPVASSSESNLNKSNLTPLTLPTSREQLLSIKMKLENLQSEYGCSSNFLLIFEDNVTEKVNLRGRDSLTAGRLFASVNCFES